MANLSQDERLIIATYPLNGSLAHLQDSLREAEQSYPPRKFSDVESFDNSATGPPKAISRLLSTLQGHEVAFGLRSKTRNGNIVSELSTLVGRVQNGDFNYEHYRVLSRLVIKEAPDVDIWNAVFDLISTHSRITPPPSRTSFTSSFQQTPWSFNTGSFADASEHRRQVDNALREELLPTLRIDVPDFIPAVFGHISRLDELAEKVFDQCQKKDTRLYTKGSGWTEWPKSAKEDLVLDWLHNLMKQFVACVNDVHPATSRQIYKGPSAYLDGSPIKRKMDVGIMGRHGNKNDEADGKTSPKSNWAQILVAGELKSNPIKDGQEPAWLDLATYAREVFRTQDRRFVLGFTLCGSRMRLWHFDRSGSSGSSSFDINQDGLKFIYVILGYCLMDDEQLGLDPTIQQSDGQRYVNITRNDQIERLILTGEIKRQAAVTGRATTCWRAYSDGDESKKPLVVKDSWQYEERPEEGELIKEATDKGVRNIARYYHHETVQVNGKNDDTIENLRRGLMKSYGRIRFKQRLLYEPESLVSASESPTKAVAGRGRNQGQSQSPRLSQKRSSSTAQMTPRASSKRSCSSFESWKSGSPIHNRVHRRVITRDFGKPLYEASCPAVLITGLIGAIKGHESLLNAGILHRDVSIGNIMLTEDEDDGFLIDYDLATRTSNDRASGVPSKTGTKIFMAIGALLGEPHSFMHDLESFFWVLFWICIHYEGRNEKGEVKRRIVPQYEDWNYLSTERLANLKAGQISKGIFDTVDNYFTEHCKPLIPCLKELHKAVFVEGSRWFSEHRELYSDMRRILEKARNNIKFEAVG
ncbi:hypothetical protein N7G274_005910 [Stereocaulon virgatum]|uniref:non-specific serine/threonine protein kinase n=1 Tax=Stereocaulon virgatum TaxID=373712 RepID=A0ABR4ADQ5_9LECA